MKSFLFLSTFFCCTAIYSQTQTQYDKLSKACELWGLVKYFHPDKPGEKFDSAFAAHVPGMLEAKDLNQWKNILTQWLGILNDPGTRVVSSQPFKEGEFKSSYTKDSLLIVKISGSALFYDFLAARDFIQSVIKQAGNSKGIIFDLRQDSGIPQQYEGTLNQFFDLVGLNKFLSTNIVPQYRTIYYSGFIPERGFTSGDYSVYDVVRNSVLPGNFHTRGQKIAWIVNRHSELPVIALSLQATGTGYILNDDSDIVHLLPLAKTFPFAEGLAVKIRTTEIVMPAPFELKANYKYSGSENLVEAAEKLIAGNKPAGTEFNASKKMPPVGNNAHSYPPGKYPALGYRILAAAKIYSVIEIFFPYYRFMDKNWKNVLKESLPEFIRAQNEIDYGLAIAKMYSNINDSHGFISGNNALNQSGKSALPPVITDWIEDKIVITGFWNDSICRLNGLNIGDVIVKLNGTAVEKLIEKTETYYAHSTKDAFRISASRISLQGPENEEGLFTIRDIKGNLREVKLRWSKSYYNPSARKYRLDTLELLNENIGYADLTRMEAGQTDAMFEKFRNTKAIIFDMRGYPRGTAWSIAPRLTEKQNIPLALFRKPEILVPNISSGEILSNRSYTEFIQTLAPSDKWKYHGKTIMLIDGNAISQSEHTCLFFESVNNTIFIGSPTAGANGDITNFQVPGEMYLYFSGQGVWHADGSQLQRKGLQPHVPAWPTIRGIISGKDEVLDKAIEWIKKNVK